MSNVKKKDLLRQIERLRRDVFGTIAEDGLWSVIISELRPELEDISGRLAKLEEVMPKDKRKKNLRDDIIQLQDRLEAVSEILVDENDSNLRDEVQDLRTAIDGLAEEFRQTEKASFYEISQLRITVAKLKDNLRWLDNHRPALEQIIQDYWQKHGEHVDPDRPAKLKTTLEDLPPKATGFTTADVISHPFRGNQPT